MKFCEESLYAGKTVYGFEHHGNRYGFGDTTSYYSTRKDCYLAPIRTAIYSPTGVTLAFFFGILIGALIVLKCVQRDLESE